MRVVDLLKGVKVLKEYGKSEKEVSAICLDSRKAEKGNIFVAVKGTQVDGHIYIEDVISKGANVIVCEKMPDIAAKEATDKDVYFVQVDHARKALGIICSNWFGNPSNKIKLVGVTGTNGKTTIATLLYEMFMKLGYKVGLLSTVCNYIGEEKLHATHTTPDPYSLNELLKKMVDAGCKYIFMEASSHSIDQDRIAGLHFSGGIFTNITRDHLDYHKTFKNYLNAKKKFFDNLPSSAFAITNIDDKNGEVMLQNSKAKKYSYSICRMADFRAKIIESHFEGMELEINKKDVFVQFIGRFNASNLLAVYTASCLLGQEEEKVLTLLSSMRSVSGRLEYLTSPTGFLSIVDYAHTPDALKNVLSTINELVGQGKVITVVGAGGNRDKGKRPLMAKEAVMSSNKVILTSDNPRFEDPEEIIEDMYAGVEEEYKGKVLKITNRSQAIRTACMLAKEKDVILIAGKGHEDYQEVKGVKHHFDDKEIVNEFYKNLKS